MGYLSVAQAQVQQNMICTEDNWQYLTNLCLFVYNHGIKELITHYREFLLS